jgi:hydroxymethylbilane synthase
VRADDGSLRPLFAALDDAPTTLATRAERAFLAALEGGCQVPIGALAVARGGAYTLYGMIADPTGARVVRGARALDARDPSLGGVALAEELRARGGDAILALLRSGGAVPAPQPE